MLGIYLSGSCKNVSVTERNSWREYFEDNLRDKFLIFNPNKFFSYDKNNPDNSKLVMDFFLHKLNTCEIVVVNLNNSALSVGTGMEVMKAVDEKKFIIGFGDNNVYDYVRDCCSIVLKNEDETIDFIIAYLGR